MSPSSLSLRSPSLATAALLLLVLLAAAGCSRAPVLTSRWRQADVVVDGADDEWPQTRYVLDREVPVTVGVSNDATDLYLCVVTADRTLQRRILSSGIELWLDPEGGSSKRLGLRLPGLERGAMLPPERPGGMAGSPLRPERPVGRRGAHAGEGRDGLSPERLTTMFTTWEAQTELRLLRTADDEEGGRLVPAGEPLQLRAHLDQTRLVLEARLPLVHADDPVYQVRRGQLGVGLRLPAPQLPERDSEFRPGVGQPGGGMGGMGGGLSPGDTDDRHARGVRVEPLQQWVRVDLVSGP